MHDKELVPAGEDAQETRRIEVVLCVENEVLSRGLEATIDRIPHATLVRANPWAHMGPLECMTLAWPSTSLGPTSACRILVVPFAQWPALQAWNGSRPDNSPRVLVIGDEVNHVDISKYQHLPVDGFIALSDLSSYSLGVTFQRIACGEMPMPAPLARQLLTGRHALGRRSDGQGISLTSRETETLELLADGLSNKQIARALKISTHGAKRLVGAVLLKMGAPNRTAAVVIAMHVGLVGPRAGGLSLQPPMGVASQPVSGF
ncbi:helix-turn-helix transcriptional regulator [Streptomyces europaeiscabiei]|uniref:helix-turn-helix transcriptional regulator n=1 Tax=Streptomyces europaeiscabiei TaxID=146819 RepID=UPI0029BDBE8D|nr:LuxR C-terminal-related transcriptional regulator [Streptomyces europaeiscabiei]MDX2525275.1 LuxR C-terminal-related transcriptional regulator [Streptomyces europaeiscabiei]